MSQLRGGLLLGVMAVVLGLAGEGRAVLIVEDFMGPGNPPTDPAFNHVLSGGAVISGGTLLFPSGQDDITFNLGVGEFVDFASVTIQSTNNFPVRVTFFENSTGVEVLSPAMGSSVVDSTGLGLSQITGIRIIGGETEVSAVTINVVPEPGTLGGVAVGLWGVLVATRRRRCWR